MGTVSMMPLFLMLLAIIIFPWIINIFLAFRLPKGFKIIRQYLIKTLLAFLIFGCLTGIFFIGINPGDPKGLCFFLGFFLSTLVVLGLSGYRLLIIMATRNNASKNDRQDPNILDDL